MPVYDVTLPAGWNQNDVTWVASTEGVAFVGSSLDGGKVWLICEQELSADQVAAWRAACVGDPPATPARQLESIGEAVAWLAALVALPSQATTVEGLRTDVNNKSAAIAGALEQIVVLLGGQ